MQRITQYMLEMKVDSLNRLKGFKNANYSTIGAYTLSYAYGGVSLHRYVNKHGGVCDVFSCGHIPKRDLFNRICAYMTDMY